MWQKSMSVAGKITDVAEFGECGKDEHRYRKIWECSKDDDYGCSKSVSKASPNSSPGVKSLQL